MGRVYSKYEVVIYGIYFLLIMVKVRKVYVWNDKVNLFGNFIQFEYFFDFQIKRYFEFCKYKVISFRLFLSWSYKVYVVIFNKLYI